jgi:RNA polymerase sigma-70 factor (ECF subfamily)
VSARVVALGSADRRGDEALLAACAAGEAPALAALFERHARPTARFVSRLLADSSEVDDLLQATFLEVWRSAGRYRGDASVHVWIFGIAYNLARRHMRGAGRRRALLELWSRQPVAHERPLDELTHDKRLVEKVVTALGALGPEHRVAVVMVDLEGVASVDAARALGVNPGTFGRRLYEARRELRDALAEVES